MKFYAKASLLALALSSPIWADPRLQVQVDSGGQHIDVKLSHAAVLQGVTQRWLQNPRRFEITIPKAEWQGKSLTPVDRGIVQKVQVQQGTGSVVIQIHSLGTPKMSWLGTPGQKAWTLRVSPTDMVASGQVPSLPGTSVASRPPVAQPKPPVLWVRGSHDLSVSDNAAADMATLGALGLVPGWPGAEVYPPQPMLGQTRAVLKQTAAAGGRYQEVVIQDAGHVPFIEKPAEFNAVFHAHLAATQ